VAEAEEGGAFMSGALALFAKTATLTPVKTRLAAGIGRTAADDFYALSLAALSEVINAAWRQSCADFVPYWALAEKESLGNEQWQGFTPLWTGPGDLGQRLHTVYQQLHAQHEYVILIGTDSPQLDSGLLLRAIERLRERPQAAVIGPAVDGGFYLFAASTAVAEEIWTGVEYSCSDTLENLCGKLGEFEIDIELLPVRSDVDTVEDLQRLAEGLNENADLLPAQRKLYDWLHPWLL
jgi:rSAM/selenodomain-associated transferase 1